MQGEFLALAGRGGSLSMVSRTSPVSKPSRGTEVAPNSKYGVQGKEVRNTSRKSFSEIFMGITDVFLLNLLEGKIFDLLDH